MVVLGWGSGEVVHIQPQQILQFAIKIFNFISVEGLLLAGPITHVILVKIPQNMRLGLSKY